MDSQNARQTAHPHPLKPQTRKFMSIRLTEINEGQVLKVQITGKLHKEDYQQFVPLTEDLIKRHGKLRLLVTLDDFHGWDAGALWEDVKFDLKHFNDIEQLAIVGQSKWEERMATFCKPFTTAKIRFFQETQMEAAAAWLIDHPDTPTNG
jgi:hypothetical protein